MSANDRFERRLPVILDSLAPTRAPEYFDDILGQVDRTRQRPGWTFPERWLPVSALTNRLAVTPRIPMRAAIAVMLLIVGLVVGALLLAGSRPRVPAPFGPAANGQVVFIDEMGAIRAGNLADGTSSIIVAGSGNRLPIMSPDGTRLAYLSVDELVVTDPRGGDPIVVATDGLLGTTYLGWTPDSGRVIAGLSTGKLVAYDVTAGAEPSPMLESSNVGGLHNDLADLFRPPAGDEILEYGSGPQGVGLYRRLLNGGDQIAVLTEETTTRAVLEARGAPMVAGRTPDRVHAPPAGGPRSRPRVRRERRWVRPPPPVDVRASDRGRRRGAPGVVARRHADRVRQVVERPERRSWCASGDGRRCRLGRGARGRPHQPERL